MNSSELNDESDSFDLSYEYTPCVIAIIIVLIYSLAVRLAYTWDYKKMHEGDLIILENQPVETALTNGHLYLIIIDTGNKMYGGTKAHVRLEIHARNFCSRVYCLRGTKGGDKILQDGNRDIFVLNTLDCLGDILSLTLLIITPGRPSTWFLDRIKVLDVSHNRKWTFPCYRWLANNNRPHFVLKLFPNPSHVPELKQFILSRGLEFLNLASIFLSYNRLGRLSRIERITIFATLLMAINFTFLALMKSDYWMLIDLNNSYEFTLFILICGTILFLVIVWCSLPEIVLRNSVPLLWSKEDMSTKLGEIQCVACNRKTGSDSATFADEVCKEISGNQSSFSTTVQCKICCQENEVKFDKEQNEVSRELIGDFQCNERKRKSRLKDPALIIKYYDLATKYVRFFQTWTMFSDKFCDVADELRVYMEKYKESELIKHRKCLIWLLGGMEEIQEQFCIIKRCYKMNTTSALLPDNILFPKSSCNTEWDVTIHETIRLTRITVFLMLITVIEWLDSMKDMQIKTINKVPSELKAQLHHFIFNLFYALDAFILKRNMMYQVCNKVLCKEIKTIDDFINIYICKPGSSDFELVRIENSTCKREENFSWNPLHDIRTHISGHTNRVVSEAINGIIQVSCCRRPLSTFADYMRYRTNQNEPIEWASICVDFTLPLIAVLSKPLISHVQQFTGQKCGNRYMCLQIQQYLQTVITNAALQILQKIKCVCKTGLRDPFQALSSAEMCFLDERDETCSEYSIAVNRFKHCLQSNNILNQIPNKCCPEGKVHIQDVRVLKLLLEEGKLKPNQLTCSQMINKIEKLIGSYYDKLVKIDKFVSMAVLTLTDSQELLLPVMECSSNCSVISCPDESSEFILKIRQQIQQMNFILAKLISRSKDKAPKPNIKNKFEACASTSQVWQKTAHQDQPFMQAVESFKYEITSDHHPFTKPEIAKIQGFAFNVHKMVLPIHWTICVYVYLFILNIMFLAFIVNWSPNMSKVVGLASIPVFIIGLMIEIFVAQPIKMLISAFVIRKYAKLETKRNPTLDNSEIQS